MEGMSHSLFFYDFAHIFMILFSPILHLENTFWFKYWCLELQNLQQLKKDLYF